MTTTPSESSSRSPYSPAARSTMAYRYNFYSRLMTSDRDLDLKAPAHVIDPALYFAFSISGQSSRATVFSIWNTMIGSTVLSIPWGMQQSGLLIGASN
jgi:sodium-coupled neutral amino acid transporter 9